MKIIEFMITTMAIMHERRENGDKGAAMVEYALLVAGIAVVVGGAALLLGGRVKTMFDGLTF